MSNWIERYIYAVGEKLPKKHREGIESELRVIIGTEINNKLKKKVNASEITDEELFELLVKLGSPAEVSERYYPNHKYLVGPELFELYRLLLVIGIISVCTVLTISSFVSVICSQGVYNVILIKLPIQLIAASLITMGSITLVFALIQYFSNEHGLNINAIKRKWHPKDLKEIPGFKRRLRRRETIIALCFTTLAIIIFNLFPGRIAIYAFAENKSATIVPIFNLTLLKEYMVYFNVFWFIQILIYGVHLKTKQWTTFSRFVTIIISLGTVGIILKMVSNPAILNVGLDHVYLPSSILPITNFVSMFIKGFLAIIMVSTTYGVVRHFYYMLKK
ncbi:MAG: hypothetical protein CVV02_10270 [Firmicutes bacterium HGW-Firmicutes-7]|nr:MAG: hypothetical protein CVV02_10270 [Firmicutes bacterium HGW-Firmicutes-7]